VTEFTVIKQIGTQSVVAITFFKLTYVLNNLQRLTLYALDYIVSLNKLSKSSHTFRNIFALDLRSETVSCRL
jgi:hypothetical protein